MIYTLTLNPAIDYLTSVEEFALGTVNQTQKQEFYPGGKGINVSRVLRELNVPTVALGFIAGFSGSFIEQSLKEFNISTAFVKLEEGNTRINMKLKTEATETEINAAGPKISLENTQQLFQKLEALKPSDSLVLAGKIANGMPINFYEEVIGKLKHRGINFVVDATGKALLSTLKHHPFLIKPNSHELEEIFDTKIEGVSETIHYGKKLQEKGAKNVLISRGKDGAILLTEEGAVYEGKSPVGTLQNSVGAGDSMVAGFLAGYLKTKNYEEALKLGLASGSATAFNDDLAKKEAIENLLGKVSTKKMN